jgi:hypothetical protein
MTLQEITHILGTLTFDITKGRLAEHIQGTGEYLQPFISEDDAAAGTYNWMQYSILHTKA